MPKKGVVLSSPDDSKIPADLRDDFRIACAIEEFELPGGYGVVEAVHLPSDPAIIGAA